jgi:hypothetical protein
MSKITKQNVGGTDYTMVGCTLTGVCNSAASDYIKSVTLSDGDVLSDGMTVVVAFANGNTAGTAPASMTIYSSDQVNYFTDSGLTQPFTLAPSGCYEIEYTGTGNAYTYISYPVMQVGSVSGPLCDASGNKSSGALWLAGDKVSINYANGCFSVIPQITNSLTATAASSVVNGAPIRIGSTVRVLFTQDLAGTANTGLVLAYNGVGIPVMVGKNGSLGAFLPFNVDSGTYKYLQAYTTLEMMFDGTQFIVLGNPVVLSTSEYTIYTDGFYYSKNRTIADLLLVSDLNNAITTAPHILFWSSNYAPANRPSTDSNYFEGFTICPYDLTTWQFQFCMTSSNRAFIRFYDGVNWRSWKEL